MACLPRLLAVDSIDSGFVVTDHLCLGHVQLLVDLLGNRRDRGAQLGFDTTQIVSVLVRHQVDRHTQVSVTAGTANESVHFFVKSKRSDEVRLVFMML